MRYQKKFYNIKIVSFEMTITMSKKIDENRNITTKPQLLRNASTISEWEEKP